MIVYRTKEVTTITFTDEEIEKIKADLAEDREMKIEEITDDDLLEIFDDLDCEDISVIYNIPRDRVNYHENSRFIKFKKER
jgi:hypothetical protein